MFQTLHDYWYLCISYFSEPDPCVIFWKNVIQNDEHLREIGDIFGIRPPYDDIMTWIIDPWIWSESTTNWFYYKFHAYGVFRRRELFEIWCTGASRGSEWGVADLTWEQWNRIMPDFLHITMEDLMRLDFEPIPQPYPNLDDVNDFLRHPEAWIKWENMTWWERNILFNKYLGIKYYQWKMYLEDRWRYKSFWFLDMRDYYVYYGNIWLTDYINYIFRLINFFSRPDLIKLIKNSQFFEVTSLFTSVIFYSLIFYFYCKVLLFLFKIIFIYLYKFILNFFIKYIYIPIIQLFNIKSKNSKK